MIRRMESQGEVSLMTIVIMIAMVDLLGTREGMDSPEEAMRGKWTDSGVE